MRYSYESFLTELGARLRRLRLEHGWTLRDMIVTHGFHLAHWQGFEKGKGISVPSLLRLCEVFDISVEQLVAGLGVVAPNAGSFEDSPVSAAVPPEQKPIVSETPDGSGLRSSRRKRSLP